MTVSSQSHRALARLVVGAALGSALALGGVSAAAAADLTGTNATITWLYPDGATTFRAQTVTVGAGAEVTCPGGGAGGGLCDGFIVASNFDLGSNTISLNITGGSSSYAPTAFNGYEFSGLAAGGVWTGYTLSTNFVGLDASRVQFTPDALFVNMQGIAAATGDTFTFTLTQGNANGGVPEPASWALMIGGFGLAGAALRRRRAAVVA